MKRALIACLGGIVVTSWSAVFAQEITVVGWNAESGDSDPAWVAGKIADLDGVDVWGMCEVQNEEWAQMFEAAAETGEQADFVYILGTTGGADKMAIIYDADRFDLVETMELEHINPWGSVRAPLVAHLRQISDGAEFLFVINHLYRSNADRRHEQAELLNEWAHQQSLPVIAVGDYNFDWEVQGGDTDHDAGFDNMVANGVFSWVRPAVLTKTQLNPHYDSVLDFVFISEAGNSWGATATILTAGFPTLDTDETSDHLPVMAMFDLGGVAPVIGVGNLKAALLERIAALEAELAELRELVESME
ncbi:MAG: hypothetical protein R3B57_09950 [Phycisphaerales bacterium]